MTDEVEENLLQVCTYVGLTPILSSKKETEYKVTLHIFMNLLLGNE